MPINDNRDQLSGEYTFRSFTNPEPVVAHDLAERALPLAIDPAGCGGVECLTGEHVPLNEALPEQVCGVFDGRGTANNTGLSIEALQTYADLEHDPERSRPLPKAVDPRGCGCTDCVTGVSFPLEDAPREALDNILHGSLVANRTGLTDRQIADFIWSECGD